MAEFHSWRTSIGIAIGAFVLAACVQVGSSGWPEKIRPHPYIFLSFVCFGVVCLAGPMAFEAYRWAWRRLHPQPEESPLEIIFEPLNPARRFWSRESHVDDYKRLIGIFWEHRVEIRNNSFLTLRNVAVTVERVGQMPVKPQRAPFTRTNTDSCDINPGCSELVLVNRWPEPKRQEGMLASESALAYGPIKVIASADNTLAAETVYDFDYQTDQMLFERGKY